MLAGGFVIWFLVRASIWYIEYPVEFTYDAVAILALYIVSFLAGSLACGRGVTWKEQPGQPAGQFVVEDLARFRRGIAILFGVAGLFLVLRMYDFFFLRGFLEVGDVQAFRNVDNTVVDSQRTTGGLGFISGIGYVLAVPCLLVLVAFRHVMTKRLVGAGIAVFIAYVLYVLISGNRYILIIPLSLAVLTLAIVEGGLRVTKRRLTVLVAAGSLVFAMIAVSSVSRDRLFGVDTEQAVEVSPTRMLYYPSHEFKLWFHDQAPLVQQSLWSYVGLAWYQTHGLYEFQKLIDYADPTVQSYGSNQFATAFYFFRVLGVETPPERIWREQLPTYGFYNSFFGPVYQDFGVWGGAIFCALVGFLTQALWAFARRGTVGGLLLYPVLANVTLNMPVNNLFSAALGIPILALTVATAWWLREQSRARVSERRILTSA